MSKKRVYAAEFNLRSMFDHAGEHRNAIVSGVTLTLPDERKFGALETVQCYVDWVLDYVSDTYPSTPCTVVEGHGNLRKHAYHCGSQITLPQRDRTAWAWREIVVLHEIAHHLTPGHEHDAVFAGCLAFLLSEVIGPEAGWAYTVLLANEGINIVSKESIYV